VSNTTNKTGLTAGQRRTTRPIQTQTLDQAHTDNYPKPLTCGSRCETEHERLSEFRHQRRTREETRPSCLYGPMMGSSGHVTPYERRDKSPSEPDSNGPQQGAGNTNTKSHPHDSNSNSTQSKRTTNTIASPFRGELFMIRFQAPRGGCLPPIRCIDSSIPSDPTTSLRAIIHIQEEGIKSIKKRYKKRDFGP
jgi:hypothetical protein